MYDSTFIYHTPCLECGSSDGNSVYSDGHSYCFVCGVTKREGGSKQPAMSADFIKGEFQPLAKRKLLKKTCEFFGYSIGTYGGKPCHIENLYWSGQRVAQHLRLPDKEFAFIGDSKKVEFFGQHLWKGNNRMVVVTEGAIDAMSIAQVTDCKLPVVSLTHGAKSAVGGFKRNLEWINSFDKVVLAFDNDADGKAAVEAVVPLLAPGKAFTIAMGDFKDANEMIIEGQGVRLTQVVYNPDSYRPDGIVSGDALWEDLISEPETGLAIPFKLLQAKLDGMRPQRLYMITAGSGIGKSTFARELIYHLMMEHKQSIGVMALEEPRKRTAKGFAGLYLNKLVHIRSTNVSVEDYKRAHDAVLANGRFWIYDHWGSSNIDVLLSKITYMAVSLGIKWLLLDHISIVVSGNDEIGESERKMIDILMTKLRSLVNSTGLGVIAIVHLKRATDGKASYNEGRAVSLTDLRGSASLEQLSDVVIALERDQQGDNPNHSRVRVLKDRDIGDTGPADLLEYSPVTGRMTAVDGEIQGAFKAKGKDNKGNAKKGNYNDDF